MLLASRWVLDTPTHRQHSTPAARRLAVRDFNEDRTMKVDAGKALGSAFALLLFAAATCAQDTRVARPHEWPDSFLARLEALALLQTLNADLLSHDSATLTLEHWCDSHRLASPARIVAVRVPDGEKPVSPEQRRELGVAPAEPIRYRRVRLRCGTVV